MTRPRAGRRWLVLLPAFFAALVVTSGAWAHAHLSPPVILAGEGQIVDVVVPTEEEDASTTEVQVTVPEGCSISGFVDADGWERETEAEGEGHDAVIKSVTWKGGDVPHGEIAFFQIQAGCEETGTYAWPVKQTYSNGNVENWVGAEDSDEPAPTIEAVSSLGGGGGGGSSTLAVIALIVGAVGVVLGGVALFGKGGRSLT